MAINSRNQNASRSDPACLLGEWSGDSSLVTQPYFFCPSQAFRSTPCYLQQWLLPFARKTLVMRQNPPPPSQPFPPHPITPPCPSHSASIDITRDAGEKSSGQSLKHTGISSYRLLCSAFAAACCCWMRCRQPWKCYPARQLHLIFSIVFSITTSLCMLLLYMPAPCQLRFVQHK